VIGPENKSTPRFRKKAVEGNSQACNVPDDERRGADAPDQPLRHRSPDSHGESCLPSPPAYPLPAPRCGWTRLFFCSTPLSACLKIAKGAAAGDFGFGQGGEGASARAPASPERAITTEPTPDKGKRPAARRVFAEKAVWLRYTIFSLKVHHFKFRGWSALTPALSPRRGGNARHRRINRLVKGTRIMLLQERAGITPQSQTHRGYAPSPRQPAFSPKPAPLGILRPALGNKMHHAKKATHTIIGTTRDRAGRRRRDA